MPALKRLAPAVLLAGFAVVAGCSDSTSPDSVDVTVLETSLKGATATFDNNAAFQSLKTLSNLFPQYAAVAALRAGMPAVPTTDRRAALAQVAERMQADRIALLSASPQALFPANVLGTTLEWDTLSHTYVAGNQTGAPANGIRVLLYAVNPVTIEPIVPLQELGHVDLTDESTAQADQLGVLLTLGATTIADYTITLVTSTTSASLEANGFIRNGQGTGQVNFDFKNVIDSQAGTLESTNRITGADGTSVYVRVAVNNTGATTLTVIVQLGSNGLQIDAQGDNATDAVTGTVKFNGTTVATIGGSTSQPLFTAVTGRTLSAAETGALLVIFAEAVSVSNDLSYAVFRPGNTVFHFTL